MFVSGTRKKFLKNSQIFERILIWCFIYMKIENGVQDLIKLRSLEAFEAELMKDLKALWMEI